MSSIPGRTLEAFVEDVLMFPTPEDVERVVALLETRRKQIESALDRFDEESQSWRDYRNSLWENVVEQSHTIVQIDDALDNWRARGP